MIGLLWNQSGKWSPFTHVLQFNCPAFFKTIIPHKSSYVWTNTEHILSCQYSNPEPLNINPVFFHIVGRGGNIYPYGIPALWNQYGYSYQSCSSIITEVNWRLEMYKYKRQLIKITNHIHNVLTSAWLILSGNWLKRYNNLRGRINWKLRVHILFLLSSHLLSCNMSAGASLYKILLIESIEHQKSTRRMWNILVDN